MEPVRISKLLAQRGVCSRREADRYIERGWVSVDGTHTAELGEKVLPSQNLILDPRATRELEKKVTILLNKPLGYVSSQAEENYENASVLVVEERQFARDRSGIQFDPRHQYGLAPAGRLDIDSTGLLVLTQDGTIARKLIGADSKIDKEYEVKVAGELTARNLKLLNHGLSLDNRPLRPAKVTLEQNGELRFVLREGRKRQIRRMCESVGLDIIALKRVRIGRIRLGSLPYGKWRYLGPDEMF